MTCRMAKKLVSPGDVVFIPAGGCIHRATVQRICQDHIVTDKDCLFYDEVGDIWFFTLRCAIEALKGVCRG